MRYSAAPRMVVATSIAALTALFAACGGDESPASTPGGGINTRTPGATATATPTTPASTATPQGTSSPVSTPGTSGTPEFEDVTPDDAAIALASLAGEHAGQIAWLMDNLEPRCNEDRAALTELAERTWRHLNETERVAIPVSGILSRILTELPPGSTTHNCEPLFAAVIVEMRGR